MPLNNILARRVILDAEQFSRLLTLARGHGDLLEALNNAQGYVPATGMMIEEAQRIYGSSEIEIDQGANTSDPADGTGMWVEAWVWVPSSDDLQRALVDL